MHHSDKTGATGVDGVMVKDVLPKRAKMWWNYPKLLKLNLLLMCAIVSDITNGYDGSMLNGLQIIPEWRKYFGNPTGQRLGTISNGVRFGQIASLIVISPLLRKYGRRLPIALGSAILLVGVVLQTAAQSYGMFMAGRILIGFGNGIQQTACPILLAELTYPSQRPAIVGITNTTGNLGQLMAAWITYGTARGFTSSWSWRLPSALQAVSSIFQLSLVYFTPESPRWLAHNNRREEARQILREYHGDGEEGSELARFEMIEIELASDKTRKASSWAEWWRTPANRYRFFIILTIAFIIQWCGNALISYYLHLVLDSIGITGTKTQLLLNGGITINSFIFGNLFSLVIDRIGRRPLFLTGMAGMFCAFLVLTVLTGVNQGQNFSNTTMSRATVAMIFVFGVFYKMPAPMVDSYIAEVSPYDLRAKAFVIKQFGDAGANLFSGYVNPIALAAIKWKYYIVWCCVLISNFLIIFFFYPETKKLSLEEVAQMLDGNESTQHIIGQEGSNGNVDIEKNTLPEDDTISDRSGRLA
jgi:sugar porter (SP) family MFS transporter